MADTYMFVTARGVLAMGLPLAAPCRDHVARVEAWPTAREALRRERAYQKSQ